MMTLPALPVLQLFLLFLMALLLTGVVIWAVKNIMHALDSPVTGPESKLIGQKGRVSAPVGYERGGKVLVAGEIWDAVLANSPVAGQPEIVLKPDTLVKIAGFDPVDPRTLRVSALE